MSLLDRKANEIRGEWVDRFIVRKGKAEKLETRKYNISWVRCERVRNVDIKKVMKVLDLRNIGILNNSDIQSVALSMYLYTAKKASIQNFIFIGYWRFSDNLPLSRIQVSKFSK